MSNALLLRLFTSEFFNSWIAVSYLFRYSDNVGIQHYLCSELKKFPTSEIEFFLPQLMHLMISKPSESVALECFIIEMCEKSTHIAIMSLWYLQAYLSDLSANPNEGSFDLCKRVLNKCQAIVFSEENDGDEPHTLDGNTLPPIPSQKVKENVFPTLVGLGAMLAGFGQPLMTRQAGQIAIAQGRRNRTLSITTNQQALTRRNTTDNSSVTRALDETPPKRSTASEIVRPPHQPYLSASQPNLFVSKKKHAYFNPFTSSPSLEDLHRGKAFSVARYIKTAQQKINKKMNQIQEDKDTASLKRNFETISVFDPRLTALGQSSVPTNTAPDSPVLSECSSSEDMFRRSTFNSEDSDHEEEQQTLSKMSIKNRRNLLRSNYFRSEIQFVLTLVDIATRLVIVPKEARMSALHAELTLLNHNLPAEICLPLWCPATTDKPYHHRVAPYLLMIEVLDDELSFEDDGYASTLYRKRQSLKKMQLSKNQKHLAPRIETLALTKELSADISDYQQPEKKVERSRRNSKSADDYAERMRTAAVMLAQLQQGAIANVSSNNKPRFRQGTEQIRQKIIQEMIALEEQRMKKMKTEGVGSGIGGGGGEGAGGDMLEDEQRFAWVVNKEDPSAAVLSENWETKKARLRAASPYGHLPNWRLMSVIVKHGSDLRQEQFAIQLIREMQRIWEDTNVDVWVK
ncbi:hypothetical protein RO3G_06227 [Rhizopus delemar RA 99-880]|uniref:1-phosphatidylinositol 4-kinase n=1 Tax=Rhizopus delemar (strain RA 99-880 / ATCC MYA-4621 / FGSC 9543 / NRRL 43880) TaxID=246409 RepID=I1BZ92_RHIO9|nr:hypothetical protein RO3G_06227 [Rhizopus delemar RA 99-880]|eukprot:EIE81522.1 hypothetical protein RO3G_06227 [Rhizopus delemar RA 99-880]